MPFDTTFFIQQQTMNYQRKNFRFEAYNSDCLICFLLHFDREILHYSRRFQISTDRFIIPYFCYIRHLFAKYKSAYFS